MILADVSRRQTLVILGMTLAGGLSSCTVRDTLRPDDLKDARDDTQAALPIVNKLRRAKGLSGLAYDPAAARAAAFQAQRMAGAGKMAHELGMGDDFGSRMRRNEVKLPAAENIATGQDTVERAVQAWIDSRKHLDNMLGGYRGLGVAAAWNTASDNRPYWAMVLSG